MLPLIKSNKMFRRFLVYQVFSGMGGGIFSIFILFSIHIIYQNPMYTGIVGFLMSAPFIFAFAVGPVVDKSTKVSIMRITTLVEFLVLILLAFVPFHQHFGVLFVFAVVLIFSIAALFETPSATAYLPQIVKDDQIVRANGAIQIASLSAGILVAVMLFSSMDTSGANGGGVDYQRIYAISAGFLAVAFLAALSLKGNKLAVEAKKSTYLADLKAGAQFVKGNVLLFIIIALTARGLLGEISYINLPMFADQYLGAQGYVILMTVGMVGGIIASSFLGKISDKVPAGWLIFAFIMLAGVTRIVFAQIVPLGGFRWIYIHIFYGILINATGILKQSLMQKMPRKDMVSRVDTISTTFVAVAVAVGALLGGFFGRIVPVVDDIFTYHGVGLIIVALLLILVPSFRKLPKINEVASAL